MIQILNFILQTAVSIFAGACLLRCYLQWLGFNLGGGHGKSIGTYLLPLSNWIVLPLRKIVPSLGRLDTASLTAAYLLIFLKAVTLTLFIDTPIAVTPLLVYAALDLAQLALSGLIGIVFASVLLSWVGPGSQMQFLLALLVGPLLAPIRKILPSTGPLDFSPLVLLVGLQVLQIILNNLK